MTTNTTKLRTVLNTELLQSGRDLPSYAQTFGLSAETLVSMVVGTVKMPPFVTFDLEETLGVPVSRLRTLAAN